MTLIAAAREKYMSDCGESFDRHATNLKELVSVDGAAKLICQNFDVFLSLVHSKRAAPTPVRKSAYQLLSGDVTDVLWFVYWFVTHELRDDGHPVVYCADKEGNPCDLSVATTIQICDGDKLEHFGPSFHADYLTEDLLRQIVAREAELIENRNNLRKRMGREAMGVSQTAQMMLAFTEEW